jgi:hypothetical protein
MDLKSGYEFTGSPDGPVRSIRDPAVLIGSHRRRKCSAVPLGGGEVEGDGRVQPAQPAAMG